MLINEVFRMIQHYSLNFDYIRFINARRRIIQPMLDSSSTVLKNNKKSKQPRNAAQKDWVNTIEGYNINNNNTGRPDSVPTMSSALTSLGNIQQPVRLMMGSAHPGTVLLNLSAADTSVTSQPTMLLNPPVQFLHVNPALAAQAAEYLPLNGAGITQSAPQSLSPSLVAATALTSLQPITVKKEIIDE